MLEHNINNCYALIISGNKNNKIFKQCSSLKKNNDDYCGRHKINKNNNLIRIDNYSEIINKLYKNDKNNRQLKFIKLDDYLFNKLLDNLDLLSVFYTLNVYYPKDNFNFLKDYELRKKLIDCFERILYAKKYEHIYRKIQIIFKNNYNLKKKIKILNLHGPCYFYKEIINNQEDFYTLDPINEIPNKFLFSFLDTNGFYYAYDIRSLKKLLSTSSRSSSSSKSSNLIVNPYSTNVIIQNVIIRIKRMINLLELKGENLEMNDDYVLSNDQKKKARIMKIFSIIDMFGYHTNINWLFDMNIKDLKRLYRIMEDIWNYRCDLSEYAKLEIIPSEQSVSLFYIPVDYVLKLNDSTVILDIILTVFERLVTESDNDVSCSLGALYVLTGLASISRDAGKVYPHLIQIDD